MEKNSFFKRSTISVVGWLNIAGAAALAIMMFLTTADVCLRYIFNRPLMGVFEIIELTMVIVVIFGLAFAEFHKEHITVDLLMSRLPCGPKNAIGTATRILTICLTLLIAWRSIIHGNTVRMHGYVTESLYIPIYPFVYALSLGFAVFCAMQIINFLSGIKEKMEENRSWTLTGLILGTILALLLSSTPIIKEMVQNLSPVATGLIGISLLLIFTFSGMYLSMAMGLIGFLGMTYLSGLQAGLSILGSTPYATSASYSFSVIPLFMLMGTFCFYSGLSEDIYYTVHKILGHLRGGLAMATVGACAGFAAVSGSGMATAATMGKVALPEMMKYKYDARLAAGSIAAGGSMGILIPPSTILILYGILTQQSIGKLFLAGFIPGILEAVFYIAVIAILCRYNPLLGPRGPETTSKEKITAFKSIWGVAGLFILVIGGIYFGIFTPTEAAGIGAFGALLLTIIRRRFTWQIFSESLKDTVKIASATFFILIGAMIFGYFLASTRLPFVLANYISELAINRYLILFFIIVVYLLLGALMDIFSIVVLTIPIIFPVVKSLGFDPIWFGVIVVRLFEMGAITPPIGINVFVLKGVAPDLSLGTIFKGILPFFIADLFHVAILVAFPQIVVFLPNLMR